METLYAYFKSLSPIPQEEFSKFKKEVSVKKYTKGDFFCQSGDLHDKVGFVLAGIFRVYYLNHEGDISIRNFCMEGRPIGSYATILTGDPAHVEVEALEDAIVLEMKYSSLQNRFEQHPSWERLGRKIAELHYISRERREYQLLTFNATERYMAFLSDFPGLSDRITQANIAAYLGVNPVTLSRIVSKSKIEKQDT